MSSEFASKMHASLRNLRDPKRGDVSPGELGIGRRAPTEAGAIHLGGDPGALPLQSTYGQLGPPCHQFLSLLPSGQSGGMLQELEADAIKSCRGEH